MISPGTYVDNIEIDGDDVQMNEFNRHVTSGRYMFGEKDRTLTLKSTSWNQKSNEMIF